MKEDAQAIALTKLADYTPPAFFIDTIDLSFELDAALTHVHAKLAVRRNPANAQRDLVLDGEDIALERAAINGAGVSFSIVGTALTIANVPDAFTLELYSTCTPDANTQLSGLYTSQGTFFTQCEAQGFRRICFSLDRPDVMSIFTVTLRADKRKYPVLLSNGNLASTRELEGGRHEAVWNDPFKKPSYLFALVGGELVSREQRVRTKAGKEHLLQVYVRAGDLDKTDYAMQSLIKSIEWDITRYGLPLDLDRFMIVATSDFNMGAMENKGLNVFNTVYVLANPATATDADFAGIESVVGHEYFHNWTGNRVTCRDWFQLSLKEGLTVFRDQEFSSDMAGSASAQAVIRIENVRVLRSVQFTEDSGPMAHPVRPAEYSAIDNFYTATVYEKGSEVVRMYQTLAGVAGFRAGMDLYFKRHDGQAVTCDDFAQAMADANPKTIAPVLEPFKRWYSQAGTPRLKVDAHYNASAQRLALHFTQSCPDTPGQTGKAPFVIPIAMGLIGADGSVLPLKLEGESAAVGTERVLVMTEAQQSFVFTDVSAGAVPSLLRGFSAPVILQMNLSDADLAHILQFDTDAFNRWEAVQSLSLRRVMSAMKSLEQGASAVQLDEAYVECLRTILNDDKLDAAFKEIALLLPPEDFISTQLTPYDPTLIHRARVGVRSAVAKALAADWKACFDKLESALAGTAYSPDAHSAGLRALKNMALAMLCEAGTENDRTVYQGMAYGIVKDASNMTDRYAALNALVMCNAPLAARGLAHFHRLFKDEALVVDKWFSLQATAPQVHADRLSEVRALLQHPDFTLKNPNRARSLVHRFCMGNAAGFHRADGAGYAFWAEQLVALDAINPQLAARLARAMDRYKQLVPSLAETARGYIQSCANNAALSADTREILERALKG
jgi:aminopeptidase N